MSHKSEGREALPWCQVSQREGDARMRGEGEVCRGRDGGRVRREGYGSIIKTRVEEEYQLGM